MVVSLVLLVLLSPVMLLIALALLLSKSQQVFFVQERVGRYGEMFNILKFCTMRNNPFSVSHKGQFDAGDNSRITPLGGFLRKWKMDELPQLWNVIVGDMSLVGPRPEIKRWVDAYPEQWAVVLRVRPGITDPASIAFRNEQELLAQADDPQTCYREDILPQKLSLYRRYVDRKSFVGDLGILLNTVIVVIKRT